MSYRKAFIVGCARSGTTWTRSILRCHPLVVTGPESHVFPEIFKPLARRGPALGRAIVLEQYDSSAAGRLGGGDAGPHRWIDRRELERLLDAAVASPSSPIDAAADVVEGVLDAFFARQDGDAACVLVEKTPLHLFYADRILRRWPEARIIEVVRDGRDVCVSLQHKAKVAEWAPAERADQIRRWVKAVRHGMAERTTPLAAGRWHVVRYEDLATNPATTSARLFEFLDLRYTPSFLERVTEQTAFRNLPKTRIGDVHHFRKGESGDWRNHFTDDDIALFERLAGATLVEAGYRP
jgi:hypothetical protein